MFYDLFIEIGQKDSAVVYGYKKRMSIISLVAGACVKVSVLPDTL
jgi:hypothetical protein